MNIKPFNDMETEPCREYFFLGLAYDLERSKQCYFYDTPCYNDRDLGLSIVAHHVVGFVYSYIELCIMSLGYEPISEAGPVRVVLFPSKELKEIFKSDFDNYYKSALIKTEKLGRLTPADYYRAVCTPKPIDQINEPSSHSMVLSVNITTDIQKALWLENVREHSDFPWQDLKQFDENKEIYQLKVMFRKKKKRDRYVRQLNDLVNRFTKIQDIHGSVL